MTVDPQVALAVAASVFCLALAVRSAGSRGMRPEELWAFMKRQKWWWAAPISVMLVVVAILVLLTETEQGAALIYSLL